MRSIGGAAVWGGYFGRRIPPLRQIRHAGAFGGLFPQVGKTAVCNVPEADPAKRVGSRKFERDRTKNPCETRLRVIRR